MALITADILNENCSSLTGWTDRDYATGVSEIESGKFRFDTNAGAGKYAYAGISRDITSPPNQFTLEIITYFDLIGVLANSDYFDLQYSTSTWRIEARFASDGLTIKKASGSTEVGTDIVKTGASAANQKWRYLIDKSSGESSSTVEVFLDNVSQGTFDCDYEISSVNGRLSLVQDGFTTNDMVSHISSIKVGTGLGGFAPTVTTQAGSNILGKSFTCNGNITEVGSYSIDRRGFCYKKGTSGTPTISDSVAYDDGNFSTGAYTKDITGLTTLTSYRIRSYTVSNSEVTYGDTVTVTTTALTLALDDTFTLSDSLSSKKNYKRTFEDEFSLQDASSIDMTLNLESIEITPFSNKMTINSSQQIGAYGYYNFEEDKDLTNDVVWSSSNTAVASIDQDGLITSYASGITFIKAILGYKSALKMLQVQPIDSDLTLDTELQQIPVTSDPNQSFNATLKVDGKNITLGFFLKWNSQAEYWTMTITNYLTGAYLVDNIPLMTGEYPTINLLEQYSYLRIGSCYLVNASNNESNYPDDENLGTDYLLFWGDTQ